MWNGIFESVTSLVVLFIDYCIIFQGAITNMLEENVIQPLLVSTSMITLASETVRSILKIDDIVSNEFNNFSF